MAWLLILTLPLLAIAQQASAVELFPITNTIQAQTNYDLKMLLSTSLASNTPISLDFTDSDIIIPDGPLAYCVNLNVFDSSVVATYTQCTCASKICTIRLTNSVSSGTFFLIRFGVLTNPAFVKAQSVKMSINNSPPINLLVDIYSAGSLILNSLIQSSAKVAALDDLAIRMTNQHSITINGRLLIDFPVQIGFKNIQVLCSIAGAANNTGIVTTLASSVDVAGLFPTTVAPNSELLLFIIGLQNQESVQTSNPIIFKTATSDSFLIDALSVTIQTTIPENIQISQIITTDTSVVNAIATFQFTLAPAVRFVSGGYLQISFPPQLQIQSDMTCTRILGLTTVTGSTASCSYAGQNLRTNNLQYPNTANSLILIVSRIRNPSSMAPTDSFTIRTFDVDGNLMCVSSSVARFTATFDTLSASLTRTITTVGMPSKYTLTVKNKNPIPSGGSLVLRLAQEAFKSTTSCSISCTYLTDTSLTFSIGQTGASTDTTIEIDNLVNPNFVMVGTSQVELQSLDQNGFGIDRQLNVPITPQLSPINMMAISFLRGGQVNSALQIGSSTEIKLEFDSPSSYVLNNDGNAVINLNGNYFKRPDENISCQQMVGGVKTDKNCVLEGYIEQSGEIMNLVAKIKILNIYQSKENRSILFINGLRSNLLTGNAPETINVLVTNLDDQAVGLGENSLGTTAFQNSEIVKSDGLTILSESSVTGETTQYTLKFVLLTPLDIESRNGFIRITLPNDVAASIGSNCISVVGQFTLSCSLASNQITIKSTQNPFALLNREISITASGIRNPFSTQPTSDWTVHQFYKNTRQFSLTGKSSVSTPKQIAAQLTKTVTQVSVLTSLALAFTLDGDTEQLSISLSIPAEQFIDINLTVSKASSQLATIKSVVDGVVTLRFSDPGCPCAKSTSMTYSISGIKNPISTALTSTASLKLINQNGFLYQIDDSIAIPAATRGAIVLSSTVQTATRLFEPNNQITFSLQIPTSLPSESIIEIAFIQPPFILYDQMTVTFNGNILVCVLDKAVGLKISCKTQISQLSNVLVLKPVTSIQWLPQSCKVDFRTIANGLVVDELVAADCSKLVQLPQSTFSSTITRSNRLLGSKADYKISFSQAAQGFIKISLPSSEVLYDPQYSIQSTLQADVSTTANPFSLTLSLKAPSNGPIEIILKQLQNSNALPSGEQKYTITLTSDGQISSYISTGSITPALQCNGAQCSGLQLEVLSYSKSVILINAETDLEVMLQLPLELRKLNLINFNSTYVAVGPMTQCYLNNTLQASCSKIGCANCEQTVIKLQVKSARTSDDFVENERLCFVVESEFQHFESCKSFANQYNALLDIKNTIWQNQLVYSNKSMVEFDFQATSNLNANYLNYLQLQLQSNHVEFAKSRAYFNYSETEMQITADRKLLIRVCKTSCLSSQKYRVKIDQIQFNEITGEGLGNFYVVRNGRLLDKSPTLNFFPALHPNPVEVVFITAIDFVQLEYQLKSDVPWKSDANIRLIFDGLCSISEKIGSRLNSTCYLKQATINQISIIRNNVITHNLNKQITISSQNQYCPAPYADYQSQCLRQCPLSTFKVDNICSKCDNNCMKCEGAQKCQECAQGYHLDNQICVLTCNIPQCGKCDLSGDLNLLRCIECSSGFVFYQNMCVAPSDCILENCFDCLISNQKAQCQRCNADFFKLSHQCLKECPDGYYSEQENCVSCQTGCKRCSSPSDCESCDTQYTLSDGRCKCQIQNCESCAQQDKCSKCIQSAILFEGQCLASCPEGYFQSQTGCTQCQSQCSMCDSTGCTKCKPGYMLGLEGCSMKLCPMNCQDCLNGDCLSCHDGFMMSDGTCVEAVEIPYLGEASFVYLGTIALGIIFLVVSLAVPPSMPIIPQIIMSILIVFGCLQTLGGLLLVLYSFFLGESSVFILSATALSLSTLTFSLPNIIVPNPLMQFISGGTWFRAKLTKLYRSLNQEISTQPILSEYLITRFQKERQYFITAGASIIIDCVIVALQKGNETPYLGVLKLAVDSVFVSGLALEYRLI